MERREVAATGSSGPQGRSHAPLPRPLMWNLIVCTGTVCPWRTIRRGAAQAENGEGLRQRRPERRQGGAGGRGSPRPRPDPSATHSSPPPFTFSHVRLRRAQIKGAAALCATAEVKERYLILTGAAGQPFATVRTHSRRKMCVFLLACVCLVARGQISKWICGRLPLRGNAPDSGAQLFISCPHAHTYHSCPAAVILLCPVRLTPPQATM